MPNDREDLHERFVSWLLAGAAGDPPRDVAFHAALCPECGRWIAAHDALTGINPGRAPLPPSRGLPEPAASAWPSAGRFAAATGALLVLGGAVAVGAARFMRDLPEGPAQQVLAVTGSPEGTPLSPTGVDGQVTSSAPSPGGGGIVPTPPTARPSAAPAHPRTASPRPATPKANPTPLVVTASPTPTAEPPTPTPSATPTPTPTPTPSPDPSASA